MMAAAIPLRGATAIIVERRVSAIETSFELARYCSSNRRRKRSSIRSDRFEEALRCGASVEM